VISTWHCTSLSAAVYTVLYDRHAKRLRPGTEAAKHPVHCLSREEDILSVPIEVFRGWGLGAVGKE
jgi:hypothetical protein